MRLFVFCLLLSSFASADTITGQITGGSIYAANEGWGGYFQSNGHIIEARGWWAANGVCPCTIDALHHVSILSGEYFGINVDRQAAFTSDGSLVFFPVTFLDVLSGGILTITGEAVSERGGGFLHGGDESGNLSTGPVFMISDKLLWHYTAHFRPNGPGFPGYFIQDVTMTAPTPVPEPGSLSLILGGVGCLGFLRRFL